MDACFETAPIEGLTLQRIEADRKRPFYGLRADAPLFGGLGIAKALPLCYMSLHTGAYIVSKQHFDINRPIHLARRDVFFERAMELLCVPLKNLSTGDRIRSSDLVLSMLKTAESHAFFAIQSSNTVAQESDFLRFLRLISDNVKSAHAMMQHQFHLEAEESFLCQFLNATPEQCVLPAMHYQRRAEDILQGLWNVLQLAHTAYRSLQTANLQKLTEEERARYHKAYESFRNDITTRYPVPGMTPQQNASQPQ